jgi:hypothetical protein
VQLFDPPRLGLGGRAIALAIACAALAVLITAAWLTPSPGGFGTHTQLGFQACQFLDRTNIPCAGCGMTTSFAYLAHGHPIQSFITQPFGFVLAVTTAAVFWCGLYIALTGKASYRLLRLIPLKAHILFWIPMGLFGWVWKIIAVVSTHHS